MLADGKVSEMLETAPSLPFVLLWTRRMPVGVTALAVKSIPVTAAPLTVTVRLDGVNA